MKKVFWFAGILVFALTACGSSNTPQAIPTVTLDGGQSSSNSQPSSGNTVSASAFVVPLSEARLSFTSVGRVTSVHVEVGDLVEAGQVLVELDTSILEAKVKEAEANVAAAQIQVKYLKRVGTDEKHLELAESDVARAQALLDSANATLNAQTHLTAPFAGTVVSVDISPAETVLPGEVVIVIGDLSRYRIETTDLSERNINKVKMGQRVNVYIEALNDELAGKVVDVARTSTTLGGDVVYKVTIDLIRQPQGLLWGMSADVDIFVEK
ncbi:MAG: HlyD family efflux transporter periplasmic adaptor subunit [Anaerolineales bacterium]|nr:HlyD family efflux transporter periplasmic adaptor subunit [Anaerolineales bacterium]